jgi:hypothetical protein
MAEEKRAKKKKTTAQKRERKERRFLPEPTYSSKVAVGGGMLGALVLGAGVYAQWIMQEPPAYAPYLFAGGAIALGASLWFGDAGAVPLRVGDAGLAIEKGNDLVRLAWCDIERVFVENTELIAKGKELTLKIPTGAHPKAVAWILAEGTRRVPEVMDVKRSALANLPEPKDADGELVTIDAIQVTGRHCAASDKPISFERDARLCPNCAQVYLKDSVPKTCVTCKAELGTKAVAA